MHVGGATVVLRMSDCYAILGLNRIGGCGVVDPAAVRVAFRQQALLCHPDKLHPGASDSDRSAACQRFQQIREAATVLLDPVLRMRHDAAMMGRLVADVGRVSDEVEWNQFTLISVEADGCMLFSLECRCGGEYVVVGPDPALPVHAECDSCSLVIKVVGSAEQQT